MPDSFGSEDHEQDQKGWRDFLHNFKSWLYYGDGSFEAGLSNVGQNPKDVLDLNAMEPVRKAKSVQLYAILSGLLKGKCLDPNQCLYCRGYGHRKFQCRKYIADKAAGNVRQINDDGETQLRVHLHLVLQQYQHLQEFQQLAQQMVQVVTIRVSGRSQVSLLLCKT